MSPSPALAEPPAAAPPAEQNAPLFRWLLPSLAVVSMLAACVLWSLKKQMWADEVFTRAEVGDRSLGHLLRALPRLGGGGMPLFSLTAWPWAHLFGVTDFGVTDLSLRLYSSAGVCAAFLVLVAALRPRLGARSAYLGVAFAMFASLTVIEQNAEARGYGLYLLLCALAIAQWLRVAAIPRPRKRELFLLALTQAGLVLGHVLGLVYAALMLAASLVSDAGRFRWRVWLACLSGWLVLVPWIPAIRASMAVGRPHGWIPVPGPGDLAMGASFWLFAGIYHPLAHGNPAALTIGWAVAAFSVVALVVAGIHGLRSALPEKRPVFLLAFALLLGPVVFFAVSRLATPIFVARYMLPSVLGLAILAACWVERTPALRGKAALAAGFLLLLLPVFTALLASPAFLDVARIDRLAAGRPVVCDWVRDFMVVERYSSSPAAVEYPLDWPSAVRGSGIAIGGYHLLRNYRRAGYFALSVRDQADVLRQPSFLVLDETRANWFRDAIQNNPAFRWKQLAQLDADHRLIEVDRRP